VAFVFFRRISGEILRQIAAEGFGSRAHDVPSH
jgi:hypothetical protein